MTPALRTEFTTGHVLLDRTKCALRAGYIQARIDALVVAADGVRRAAGVPQADRQRRIAVVHAQADRLVVDDGAGAVRLAQRLRFGGRRVVRDARVAAFAFGAGEAAGAFVVRLALHLLGRARQLAVLRQEEAVLANADRLVVARLALLQRFASDRRREGRRGGVARIDALVVNAHLVRGAVLVRRAGDEAACVAVRQQSAFVFGDAAVAARASALYSMQHRCT